MWCGGSRLGVLAAFLWRAPGKQREVTRIVRSIQRVILLGGLAVVILAVIFPDEVGSRVALYSETLSPYSTPSELAYRTREYPLRNFLAAFDTPRWITATERLPLEFSMSLESCTPRSGFLGQCLFLDFNRDSHIAGDFLHTYSTVLANCFNLKSTSSSDLLHHRRTISMRHFSSRVVMPSFRAKRPKVPTWSEGISLSLDHSAYLSRPYQRQHSGICAVYSSVSAFVQVRPKNFRCKRARGD